MNADKKTERKQCPREKTNFISALYSLWTWTVFRKGFKRNLEVNDLYKPLKVHQSDHLGDRLAQFWSEELNFAKLKNRKPSLRKALINCFGCEFMILGFYVLVFKIGVRVIQPLLIGKLISYFSSTEQMHEAYLYAFAVIGCSFLSVSFNHPYTLAAQHIGMKVRIACCSLIYRKALRLRKAALSGTSVGHIVNLLSNDVNRFDVVFLFTHLLWAGPLLVVVCTYFIYLQVEKSAFIGVAILLSFVPIQGWLGKLTSILRLKTALRTDERVRLMHEIITGIQVIKMYSWEEHFSNFVAWVRKNEINQIRRNCYIRGITVSFIMFNTRIALFATVLSYIFFGNNISAEKVFIITSYYNILRDSMTASFPLGIAQVAEAYISVGRLQAFMLFEETDTPSKKSKNVIRTGRRKNSQIEPDVVPNEALCCLDGSSDFSIHDSPYAVVMTNLSAKWQSEYAENTLTNLNMTVFGGHLVAVIGPVGSGKTSFLHTILHELQITQGTLELRGVLSYAPQEPWLFAGTIRQNILFGLPMDRRRYKEVIKRCALDRDFTLLPFGDKTIVGDRGVKLSGGQRARINLARAVYRDADIYLLDDPLSAVDTQVGKKLFESCISSFLKGKTCILVTHQLQYLENVDNIFILTNGTIAAEGDFKQLKATGLDFAQLLEEKEKNFEDTMEFGHPLFSRQESIRSYISLKDESLVMTSPVQEDEDEERVIGSVGGYVYRTYFKNGGNIFVLFILANLFLLAQLAGSGGDYFITYWVNLEEQKKHNLLHPLEQSFESLVLSPESCIYIYSFIIGATVILTLLRSFVFFNICMRSSINLHNNMFNNIIRTTMRFFNTNSAGRILNRFSKDMGAVDEMLPNSLVDCFQIGLTLLGIIIVVAIVNYWLLIPTIFIGILFYILRVIYLSTSRSIKRLEATTRSPVFGHLNASLQGLTTIRAFGAEQVLIKEFDNHQDLHSGAWFLFLTTTQSFAVFLDLACIIYIAVVTMSFLVLGNEKFGGNVGLAITQSIGLTGMLQWGVRQSTEVENQMTSVERILQYTEIEQEFELEEKKQYKPPTEWPQKGEIRFENLYLRYSLFEPYVLKGLNFTIIPQQKVGIVGRTAAGKTSLITALFRLAHLEGNIFIDHINTNSLSLHNLRSKISIIPQEPMLFSTTLRKNLDPFNEYSDYTIWNALDEVGLKKNVLDMPLNLHSEISEGGTNFSVGQRQLLCLARAIIRNNKILILDEVTANVDPQTDGLIQQTIRKKFSSCTVLTIAHRLHTVMDSDRVLVMDAGIVVEFDHPYILLQNTRGVLFNMVKDTGKVMGETLYAVAEQSYNTYTDI